MKTKRPPAQRGWARVRCASLFSQILSLIDRSELLLRSSAPELRSEQKASVVGISLWRCVSASSRRPNRSAKLRRIGLLRRSSAPSRHRESPAVRRSAMPIVPAQLAVRGDILFIPGPLPGRRAVTASAQEQTSESGLHGDRVVPSMFDWLVPAHKGAAEAAPVA